MRLRLFKQQKPSAEHIDIYYTDMTPRLRHIIATIEDGAPRVVGKLKSERVLLSLRDVCYVDTVDRRTFLYLQKEVYQSEMTLSAFLSAFENEGFARINKSQVLNLHYVRRIRPTLGMRVVAVLDNGEQLIISRSYRDQFEGSLKAWGGIPHEKMDS